MPRRYYGGPQANGGGTTVDLRRVPAQTRQFTVNKSFPAEFAKQTLPWLAGKDTRHGTVLHGTPRQRYGVTTVSHGVDRADHGKSRFSPP